ncbi:MAG: hypothetical protein WDM91_11160 [Rhizomicrobium sp.]
MRYRSHAERQLARSRTVLGRGRRQREQDGLTSAQIRARIVTAICDADDKAQALSRDALLRTNIPPYAIDEHFAAAMKAAEEMRPGLAQRARSFA